MIWLHTFRAELRLELKYAAKQMWAQISRGVPHAELAAHDYFSTTGQRLNTIHVGIIPHKFDWKRFPGETGLWIAEATGAPPFGFRVSRQIAIVHVEPAVISGMPIKKGEQALYKSKLIGNTPCHAGVLNMWLRHREMQTMHITTIRSAMAAFAFAALLAAALPADAETINMKAELKASNQIPPNDSKGTGSVVVTYDTASKKLTWKGSASGTTGNPTAQHFHGPAEPGKNAGVVVPISNLAQGEATLTDAQAADLMAGKWYVNVHTTANPAGELRGQVVK